MEDSDDNGEVGSPDGDNGGGVLCHFDGSVVVETEAVGRSDSGSSNGMQRATAAATTQAQVTQTSRVMLLLQMVG